MRPLAGFIALFGLSALAGCQNNPLLLQRQVADLQQQQQTIAKQAEDFKSRADTLDKDNQELETLLAQERQGRRVADDQIAALQDQLHGTTNQLERLRQQYVDTERKAEALVASSKRRVGAEIRSNNSQIAELPALNLPGVQVRRDGDVVRIEIPAARLFDEGSSQLRSDAGTLLTAIGAEINRVSPGHFIGVEGHTDNSAARGVNLHQFSAARAGAVLDYLAARSELKPNQLFVTGHGPNHPVVSNATGTGRERNRRLEIVIYPEKAGG